MGDFQINIMQYDDNKGSQEVLDKMHLNFLLSCISSLSRVILLVQIVYIS